MPPLSERLIPFLGRKTTLPTIEHNSFKIRTCLLKFTSHLQGNAFLSLSVVFLLQSSITGMQTQHNLQIYCQCCQAFSICIPRSSTLGFSGALSNCHNRYKVQKNTLHQSQQLERARVRTQAYVPAAAADKYKNKNQK